MEIRPMASFFWLRWTAVMDMATVQLPVSSTIVLNTPINVFMSLPPARKAEVKSALYMAYSTNRPPNSMHSEKRKSHMPIFEPV